jgi:hypothetical protein
MATVSADAGSFAQTETFCYIHPQQETGLRCTQCGQAICVRCVVPAAVGQVCRACARARRPVNYQLTPRALALGVPAAGFMSLVLCAVTLLLIAPLPIYAIYFLMIGSVGAARLVVRVLDRLTRAKRGKAFQITVGTALALGALPVVLAALALVSAMDAVLVLIFAAGLAISTMTGLR